MATGKKTRNITPGMATKPPVKLGQKVATPSFRTAAATNKTVYKDKKNTY